MLKHALANMQRNIDVRHHQHHVEAVDLAASVGVHPSMPRVNARQVHRANAPAADPEVYYRINLTSVFFLPLYATQRQAFSKRGLQLL